MARRNSLRQRRGLGLFCPSRMARIVSRSWLIISRVVNARPGARLLVPMESPACIRLSKSDFICVRVASPIERFSASRSIVRSSDTASRSRFLSFENLIADCAFSSCASRSMCWVVTLAAWTRHAQSCTQRFWFWIRSRTPRLS